MDGISYRRVEVQIIKLKNKLINMLWKIGEDSKHYLDCTKIDTPK